MDELLAMGDRGRCAPPAPPQGLVLEHVSYPKAVDPWHKNAL
jgi:tRNA U38,U39,U40 pseudouridine synthase TruA